MKRSLVLFFAAAALCILCACGANEAAPAAVIVNETASPAPTPTATPRPTATPAPVELYGVTVRWDDEEIDLRGKKIEDAGAEVSEALPALPRVRRVDMTDCGLTDEEMGALQEAFPDVTFVWTLRIYVFFVPSDSDYFITNPDAGFKMNVQLCHTISSFLTTLLYFMSDNKSTCFAPHVLHFIFYNSSLKFSRYSSTISVLTRTTLFT